MRGERGDTIRDELLSSRGSLDPKRKNGGGSHRGAQKEKVGLQKKRKRNLREIFEKKSANFVDFSGVGQKGGGKTFTAHSE